MLLALTGWELGLALSAVAFIVFALIVSMLVPRSRPEFPKQYLGWFIGACVLFFAVQMTAVLLLAEVGEEHEEVAHTETEPTTPDPTNPETTEPTPTEPEPTTEETETTPPPAGGEGDPVAGKEVFLGASACGSCHTLADAGTSGTIGPNLDESQPSVELAVDRVTNGQGAMPAFGDSLSEQQIADVAAYVSTAGG